ncbi:MAG: glycosyltransferase [Cytophagales bacterium]|nr:glycosyltransferase [Cytophagales bacterium]
MASDLSIIIPVFNRPDELEELLDSLVNQSDDDFDVIVVDDGSEQPADSVVAQFKSKLDIQYFYKQNSGPGDSRNYGCKQSTSDFFIFFDSDCVIPPDYIKVLRSNLQRADAYGGPDRDHVSFTPIQKAISYSMTSVITTGGIRGRRKSVEKFHPRSFNMGFSKEVFEKTKGFSKLRFGEDIDLSIRIFEYGFKTILIPECYVFHKRRTDFRKFFKQVFNSGIARINLYKRHPGSLKLPHFFPAVFVIYQVLSIPHAIYREETWALYPTVLYLLLIFANATKCTKNPWIGVLSVWASIVQLFGYGLGFIKGFIKRMIFGQSEFHAYQKTFYD